MQAHEEPLLPRQGEGAGVPEGRDASGVRVVPPGAKVGSGGFIRWWTGFVSWWEWQLIKRFGRR